MNAGQNSLRSLAGRQGPLRLDTVCTSCRHRLTREARRNVATAAAEASPTQPPPAATKPVTANAPKKAYRVMASPVVSRPPVLTRDLTSFESAYYLYQKRLNERLAQPFSRYFYYKKGTPADEEWKRKIKPRQTAARDVGVYNAYGEEGWNDEVLVGDATAEYGSQVEALIRDAEGKTITNAELVGDEETGGEAVTGDETQGEGQRRELTKLEVPRPMPRTTKADQEQDLKSLNRQLHRTLYLLVKNQAGRWRFPEDRVYGKENLHQAAERVLVQACGVNMNTWIVANHPVGHYEFSFHKGAVTKTPANPLVSTSKEEQEREEFGERVFFMKTRIMAGQADLSKNAYGDQDFIWVTKDEMQSKLAPKYWASVKHMLAER